MTIDDEVRSIAHTAASEAIEHEVIDEEQVIQLIRDHERGGLDSDDVYRLIRNFITQPFPELREQRCPDGMAVTRVIDQVLRDPESQEWINDLVTEQMRELGPEIAEAVEQKLMEKRVVVGHTTWAQARQPEERNGDWPFRNPVHVHHEPSTARQWVVVIDAEISGVWCPPPYDNKLDAERRAESCNSQGRTVAYVIPIA